MKEDKRIYIMAQEVPFKAVMKMGIPVTVGMLFMVVYNLVDTYFIGLLHNDLQLAATNLAYPVMMILVAISGIVGNGGASYIARCMGADESEEANHTLTIGFELIIYCSLFLSCIGLFFIDSIVSGLGAKSDTFLFTKDYVSVLILGSLMIMGNYAIGQLLRSEGSTFLSMIGMITGTLANVLLDPLFIFAFHMEIKGAAIATVLGNGVALFIMLFYYFSGKTILRPSLKLMSMDLRIIKEMMLVGIPHTLEQFFSTAAILVNNNLAASYGALAVAGMGIANKVMSFGQYVYQGMAAGCQPLMGYNYGAKAFQRLKDLIRASIFVTTSLEILIMILYGVFAPQLIQIFTSSNEVIQLGTKALRAFMCMLPFVGSTSMARNTFNAIGKPFYAFGITIVRQLFLYIPFLLVFNHLWGFNGLIFAQPVEEMVCMVISLYLLFHVISRFSKE